MATTVQQPPVLDRREPEPPRLSDSGNGGRFTPSGVELRAVGDHSAAASTGIWVILFGISMSFAALTSALVVRKGSAPDWRHLSLPYILYLNTLVLIASSFTLEGARRRIVGSTKNRNASVSDVRLKVTFLLGLLFVGGQYLAWSQLRSQGVYLATNPSSSFFYVLTVAHAMHVIGGLIGLSLIMRRIAKATLRLSTLGIVSRYWHFMGALWIYLLILLRAKM